MNSEKSYIIEDSEEDVESLFFDSYAFFEILKGNPHYLQYSKFKIITTRLNLFELYIGLLRNSNEEKAELEFERYYNFVVDFDSVVLKQAAKLKMQLNKRDVSMVDCIGYSLAKQLGIKFLTGDSAFEKMENVEFVR